MYEVRMPHGGTDRNAATISRHRTHSAAFASIAKEMRQMKRRPGQQNSWLDRFVWDTRAECRVLPSYDD